MALTPEQIKKMDALVGNAKFPPVKRASSASAKKTPNDVFKELDTNYKSSLPSPAKTASGSFFDLFKTGATKETAPGLSIASDKEYQDRARETMRAPTDTEKQLSNENFPVAAAISSGVKELPTMLARTATKPYEVIRDLGVTIGKKLAPFVPEAFRISPESKIGRTLSVMTPEGGEDIKLPGAQTPLVAKPKEYTSSREVVGDTIEAIADIALAATPFKGAKLLKDAFKAGKIGFALGTAEALKDENIDSIQGILWEGTKSALMTSLTPIIPRIVKNVGQKTFSESLDALNRFTNKKTGESLKVIRATPKQVIDRYASSNGWKLRREDFTPRYEAALAKSNGSVSADKVREVTADFLRADPEGKLGKYAEEINARKNPWSLQELQDLFVNKMDGKLPKYATNKEQAFAKDSIKGVKNLIAEVSPEYRKVNEEYGKVTQYLNANKIIDESGSGVVGTTLSAVLGGTAAGAPGAAVALTAKSAKAQRLIIEGFKKIEEAKTAQEAKIIYNSMLDALPDKETQDALIRAGILLGIRED